MKMRYFGFSPSVGEIFVRGDWWAVAQWVEEDFRPFIFRNGPVAAFFLSSSLLLLDCNNV